MTGRPAPDHPSLATRGHGHLPQPYRQHRAPLREVGALLDAKRDPVNGLDPEGVQRVRQLFAIQETLNNPPPSPSGCPEI